ncbi:uncharacterized protein LOC136080730 isoform X1 [Hydra vulgaris]|uniref:Uncharacterized protein LOC136080730 isoform X1 n=1 Tax=Hydra vulgaris TaxID=6087 RepID=A0ABM4BX71_HYDVU
MKADANITYQTVSLGLVLMGIALSCTALFTNHWFDQVSISQTVVYSRGLWLECGLISVDRLNATFLNMLNNQSLLEFTPLGHVNIEEKRSICHEISAERKTNDLLVTRALLSLCVIFLCLALVMTFLSRVYNGRYRDFTTATVLFANVLKVAALLLYYSKNRVYTDFNYHCALGYSYLLGWLSFSILVFATTLSILSRKNDINI